MATAARLSVSQFSRQFKARTGLSPHQFLMQLRVDAACRLLRDSSLRAHLGTTPAAIRRAD